MFEGRIQVAFPSSYVISLLQCNNVSSRNGIADFCIFRDNCYLVKTKLPQSSIKWESFIQIP